MRITISNIVTTQGVAYYKVTDYEMSGAELLATSLAELIALTIDRAGFAVDIEDCHMLVNKATSATS